MTYQSYKFGLFPYEALLFSREFGVEPGGDAGHPVGGEPASPSLLCCGSPAALLILASSVCPLWPPPGPPAGVHVPSDSLCVSALQGLALAGTAWGLQAIWAVAACSVSAGRWDLDKT